MRYLLKTRSVKLTDHNFVLAVYVLFGMCFTVWLLFNVKSPFFFQDIGLSIVGGGLSDAWGEYLQWPPPPPTEVMNLKIL